MWKQQFANFNSSRPSQVSKSSVRRDSLVKDTEFNDIPVKHSDGYKIVIVLDESGSMEDIANEMRKSINSLIKEQKTVDRPCSFTLVKFNQDVKRVLCNRDLKEVRLLTQEDYRPNGTTALYDAVGDTINWFRYERDVLMVVVTDGQENASKKYRKSRVMEMLKEKEDYCGWSYVYLGCDLQTAKQGDSMGFQKSAQASNCCVMKEGYSKFIDGDLNIAIKNRRTQGISVQAQLNRKY